MSSGNKKSGRNKVPKLKINSPANQAGFTETSNKASIPDDEEAFFIKSSRECQAKQPYTATYNQSNRPDSVSNKKSITSVRMQKDSNNG